MYNSFLFLGLGEIIVIFIVLMILFGPTKIPSLAKDLGQAYRQFKNYSEEIKRDINESVKNSIIEEEIIEIKSSENTIKRTK